jgi:AraC family transcriptional activator of pobA
MDRPYYILDLKGMPLHQEVASLGDSLVLHDNFEKQIAWDDKSIYHYMDSPVKISSVIMLFFCLQGEIHLRANSQDYYMRADDVDFVYNGLFSEIISFSRDVKFALIVISEDFYYPMFNKFDTSVIMSNIVKYPICRLSPSDMQECISLYTMMKQRLTDHTDDIYQQEIIKGYLQSITFCVYSQYKKALRKEEDNNEASRHKDLFNRFVDLLQKKYIEERKINYYADKLCVTPRYLSRVIHDVSGHFASEHIDLFVIAEAKQLLISKRYTILQISEMLNFTSQSFFGRYFKKFTGVTPKEYQNMGL